MNKEKEVKNEIYIQKAWYINMWVSLMSLMASHDRKHNVA